MTALDDVLAGRRVVICAGSGGVGKTTTAATIAIGLAAQGRRACVVTIDPARRLAASLGLDALGNEPQLIDATMLAANGIDLTGELWAMMLDPKATLDELVGRLAPDAEAGAEILANRIYRELSGAVAGTQEYTAMAKLADLHGSGRFDVIVLDTPPSRNALDFIDAPDRLTGFLEGRALRTLVAGSGVAARVVGRGTSAVLGVLGRVTGTDLLRDVGAFLRSLGALLDGFRARAREIKALLADRQTTFVLISSPQREPATEAVFFAERLRDAGLEVGGLIVNAVHVAPGELPDDEQLVAALGAPLAGRVARTCAEAALLAARDRDAVAELALALDIERPIAVPHLAGDVHDAAGLAAVHRHLFGVPVTFEQRDPAVPPASDLLAAILGEYRATADRRLTAGPPATPEVFSSPDGAFLVGFAGDVAVCCAGLRTFAEGIGEIKRMYVLPAFRRHGIAQELLVAIEGAARELGMTSVRLDCQRHRWPLYAAAGYREIPDYNANANADVWAEKTL